MYLWGSMEGHGMFFYSLLTHQSKLRYFDWDIHFQLGRCFKLIAQVPGLSLQEVGSFLDGYGKLK